MLGPVEEVLADPADRVSPDDRDPARGRPAQRPAAAEAREHAARLLADRGRPRPGGLRADRPGRADGRAGEQLPLGLRAGRAVARRWTARRCPSPSTSTARCGRRSSSTSSPTPSSSPSKARSRSRCAPTSAARGAGRPRHGHRHSARGDRPRSSSASTGSRARAGARRRGPASGWRWCRSWSSSTAARCGVASAGRPGQHVHRVDPDRQGPPAGRPRSGSATHAGLDGARRRSLRRGGAALALG